MLHLHPINLIAPLDHMIETVFPMRRHQRVAALIRKKESSISVNHQLHIRSPLELVVDVKNFVFQVNIPQC